MLPTAARPPSQNSRLFETVFSDRERDPLEGDPGRLNSSFRTGTGELTPSELRNQVAKVGRHFTDPVAFGATHGGIFNVYVKPILYEPVFPDNHPLEEKFVAFNGELFANQPHYSVLPDELFHKTPTVIAHTAGDIAEKYADDPDLDLLGPHTDQDQEMEKHSTRRIVHIPHSLVNLFLMHTEGVTANQFWTDIYPVIVDEGRLEECEALIEYFQIMATAVTAGGASTVDYPQGTAPKITEVGKDLKIMAYMKVVLDRIFPGMDANTTGPGGSQDELVIAVANLTAEANRRHNEVEERKLREERKKQSLAHRLGKQHTKRILHLTGCQTEEELFARCPMWRDIAESEGKEEGIRAAIQNSVDGMLEKLRYFNTVITITPFKATQICKEDWFRRDPNQIAKGILANFLLHGPSDEEWEATIVNLSRLAADHSNAPTLSDSNQMNKFKVYLAGNEDVELNFRRMHALASVCLPSDHKFLTKYLAPLMKMFDDQKLKFRNLNLYGDFAALNGAKGVLFLEYLSLQINSYWRDQQQYGGSIDPPLPGAIFDLMERKQDWIPRLDPSYVAKLRLKEFLGLQHSHVIESDLTSGGGVVTVAGLSVPAIQQSGGTNRAAGDIILANLLATAASAAKDSGGEDTRNGGSTNTTVKNDTYESQGAKLFGKYKRRRDPSTNKEFTSVRVKATATDKLPDSKHCSGPMCLAWHVKGMCNAKCTRVGDHKPYSDQDYKQLVEWCEKNYPGKDE